MAEVKWIKIVTDIFDDEKMLLIESLPSADSIIVIWFKLLCLAGKNNNSGVFMLNDRIAYTDEMLATIFRRDVNTVRLALKTFEMYGMVEIINDVITIPNWSKHQTLDQLEERKEYMKGYMKKYREKQKMLSGSKSNSKVNSKVNVNSLEGDIERDIDIEEEREEDIDMNISKDILCSTFVQRIIDKWNSLNLTSKLTKITPGTNRYKMLRARVKQYGEEEILKAIDEINKSKFLKGQAKDFEITFDWFIKPNNFIKVLEGNYKDNVNEQRVSTGNYTSNNSKRFNSNVGSSQNHDDIEAEILRAQGAI